MGILGNSVTGAGNGGYSVDNSLRIRSSASAYLSRTPGSSPTDAKKYTYSTWVKKSKLATANQFIYGCGSSGSDETYFSFNSSDKFEYLEYTSGAYQINVSTTAVYRDPSAWYHVVLVLDTTQATSSDRVKLYINGVQQTLSGTFPSLNYATSNVNSTDAQNINRLPTSGGLNFDGYYAETIMVDGQALTPSSFGETSSDTGVWKPKAYTGTYGTNGFYLKFSDIATTSGSNAGLGKDFSGNGNYWNTNNISVTSGVTYDAMLDSPTPKSATVGNFATLNPLAKSSSLTVSNGNLTAVSSSNTQMLLSTIYAASGKYYAEFTCNSAGNEDALGIATSSYYVSQAFYSVNKIAAFRNGGNIVTDTFGSAVFPSWTTNDVVRLSLDLDNQTFGIAVNGGSFTTITITSYNSHYAGEFWTFHVFNGASGSVGSLNYSANFGQRPFAYTPPSGFKALQTYNLPTPTIGASSTTLANKYFDATLWTGDGTNGRAITNAGGFQPDLVWAKARSSAIDNWLTNSVTGASKQLSSNLTDAEATYNLLSAFNSNGFSVNGGTYTGTNGNGTTYVGWQWKGGNGSVSNTSGSITSTVSANTTSGFSIVTYTGTGSAATVGHGLGVAPKMIIVKCRSQSSDWPVYHVSAGATQYCNLNSVSAFSSNSAPWNNTAPTSSVFTVGTSYGTNWPSNTLVAYCFAEKAGFSKFGIYTGNSSSDGPFVYCGFRPKYVMIKCSTNGSAGYNWFIFDTSRRTYNVNTIPLFADIPDAEGTGDLDILSNGFKLRNGGLSNNGSGKTYIYMAFAEHPFNYSLAR